MRTALVLVLSLMMIGPAQAKPKNCFSKSEQTVEWQVRHGIRLREFAYRCNEHPYSAGTLEIWRRIDEKNAAQFQKVRDARAKTFEREFPTKFKEYLEVWNGRIIIRYRDYYLTDIDCAQTKRQLEEIDKKGFGVFVKIAAKYKPEALMDYRQCM